MHQEWQEKYQFRMPKPNRFICKNIPIYSNPDMCSEVQTPPTLLQINDKHEVWFKQSDQISNPYGSIHLQIQMPNGVNASPMDYLVTQILNSCFSNIISKELEDAKLAGINHSVKYYIANMCVSADGFSEMLPRLTESLIKLIKTTKLDENTYNSGKAAAKKALQDAYYSSPYLQLYDSRFNVFRNKSWPAAVLEEALANVEIDMVQDYLNHVFDRGYFKLLVCGNFKECHALEMASMIGDHLQMKPMLKEEYKPTCLLNFEPGQYIHCQEAKNEKEANNALFSTIYGGSMFNLKDKVAVALIQKILSSEFFDQLRTQEQIGYVANAYGVNYKGGKTTISCVIQSEQNPVYLSQRVTKFMNGFGQNIQEFPESKLSKMVQLAIVERRIGYKTVLEEAKAVWNQIDDNDYNFAMREQEIACLQEITKEYIIQVWNRCINPNTASELTRVDMQIWSKALGMPSTNTMESYPEGIIALHGCLEKDGITGFSLEDLHQLLKDRTVGDIEAIFSKIVAEGVKTTKVKSDLEMALKTNKPGLVGQKRPGLLQTADGKWIITKLEEFKTSQKLHELPDPITPLIPKYE